MAGLGVRVVHAVIRHVVSSGWGAVSVSGAWSGCGEE